MNKNKYIESAKVDSCLEVLGVLQFKNTIENLCLYWFDGVNNFDNHKDVQLLTKYIFLGGAFGNSQNQEAGSLAKSGKKKTSLAAKLFPSMDTMINFYGSFLKNHKWLLPLYPILQLASWNGLLSFSLLIERKKIKRWNIPLKK